MTKNVKEALTPANTFGTQHGAKRSPSPFWDYGFIELVIPRRRFTYTSMLSFLAEYRHLKDYAHIDFEESTYKGKQELLVDLDEIAVPLQKGCDYFWSEVKDVLAILENLLSSAKSE